MFHKRYLLVLLLALSSLVGLYSKAPFRIIEQDENHLLLNFILPDYKILDYYEDNEIVQRVDIPNSIMLAEPGYPVLPYFADIVGIPIDGDISLSIDSIDYDVIHIDNIDYADKQELQGDVLVYSKYKAQTNEARSIYPEMEIIQNQKGFAGNRHFAGFSFFPFTYNSNSKSLKIAKNATIMIQISGSKSKNTQASFNNRGLYNKVGDQLFINNEISKNWIKPKEIDYESDCTIQRNNTVNKLQIWVKEDGLYKITKEFLIDAIREASYEYQFNLSFDINRVDPRLIELSDRDGVVPIRFVGEDDGSFDNGDYFEFWGKMNRGETSYYDDYTDSNIYNLYISDTNGSRLTVENGGLLVNSSSNLIRPDAFEQEIHIEEQNIMDNLAQGYRAINRFFREDNWFWNRISAPNLKIFNFDLQYPLSTSIRTFEAEVCLHGLTYSSSTGWDHHAVVRLNSVLIDNDENGVSEETDTYWDGQTEKIFKNYTPLGNANLYHGDNNLFISMPGDTVSGNHEVILLDYLNLKYWREFKTDTDFIKFVRPSNRPFGLYEFNIEGFSSSDVSIYKLGVAIMENIQVTPFSETGGAPYTVTFQDSVITDGFEYVAITESEKKVPEKIIPDYPSYLKSHSNRADLIMITVNDFLGTEGMENLQAHWEDMGLVVKVVDVQDIYDEFNNGIKSAQSIKDFIKYAYNNWEYPQLKYTILIGDGTYNERDDGPYEKYNLIPVKKIWTHTVGATASDTWYGCIIGDDFVPDVIISRIPVREADEIQNLYEKVNKYASDQTSDNPWRGRVTLAAGGSQGEGHDIFSQQEEAIRSYGIPDDYFVTRVYVTTVPPTPSGYYGNTFKLKDSISEGITFLQFMGHGGGRIWADFSLLNYTDIRTLTNTDYFFVSSLSCFGAAFDSDEPCINEGFVLEKDKGAVGSIGFTGVGYVDQDLHMGLVLTEALFNPAFSSVGESINYTLANFYATQLSNSARDGLTSAFCYLGDPVLSIHRLGEDISCSINKDFYSPGDTIQVSVQFPENVTEVVPLVLDKDEIALNYLFSTPIYDGHYEYSYVIPNNIEAQYLTVRIAGISPEQEYIALKKIPVFDNNINLVSTIPEEPCYDDSVHITANIVSVDNILDIKCNVIIGEYSSNSSYVSFNQLDSIEIPMEFIDQNTVKTIYPINPDTLNYLPGYEVHINITVETEEGSFESPLTTYNIKGPDISINSVELVVNDGVPGYLLSLANYGNMVSPNTEVKIYYTINSQENILGLYPLRSLNTTENRELFCPIGETDSGEYTAFVTVNQNRIFPEISYRNNLVSIPVSSTFHEVVSNQHITTKDDNLVVDVPENFGLGSTLLELKPVSISETILQPDIFPVTLKNESSTIAYTIKIHNSSIVDSLGNFLNNRKLRITANISTADSLTQVLKYNDSFRFYQWHDSYKKWFIVGGLINPDNNKVSYDIDRNGVYALMNNADRVAPSIEANVAEQEFTRGGYIASDGIISLSFYDDNGIDVITNPPRVTLNGDIVEDSSISLSINEDNINSVPMNYKLDLDIGDYSLRAECCDVNGNFKDLIINFRVNDEFEIINVANYPNPIVGHAIEPVNDGRTRFTYLLTAPADKVTLKIYTVSGRLVKTFRDLPKGVGYHEYPRTVYGWDCRDEDGFYLANGVYFYRIIAKNKDKTVEKTQKMAILR